MNSPSTDIPETDSVQTKRHAWRPVAANFTALNFTALILSALAIPAVAQNDAVPIPVPEAPATPLTEASPTAPRSSLSQ
ncbi:MAG: hypothetical protein HC800_03175 [Phormidesmis sp. RL_2_1]|nr:hypothetical protein [Phormidesmis sp. RL_2_1]